MKFTSIKKRLVSMSLVVGMMAGMFALSNASTQTFADVSPDHWAYSAIEEMVAKGYLNGMPDGTFAPNATVTYAEVATMLSRSFYGTNLRGLNAADYSSWYGVYFKALSFKRTGTLEMMVDRATEDVSREWMAIFLWCMADGKGMPNVSKSEIAEYSSSFIDGVLGDESTLAVKWGIMSGTSETTFNPEGTLTRAEAAMILKRLCDTNILLEDPLDGTPEESWLAPGQYDTRVYTVPADLNKDGFVTEEEVVERLEECKVLFPDGSYTKSCGAFMSDLRPEVWGNLPGRTVDQSDLTNIRVGDIWVGQGGAYFDGVYESALHTYMFSAVVYDGLDDVYGDGSYVMEIGDYYRIVQGSAKNDSDSSNKIRWDTDGNNGVSATFNRWHSYNSSNCTVTTYYPA